MSNENVFDNSKHRDVRRLPNCASPTRDEITVLPNREYINGWKLRYYFEIVTTPCVIYGECIRESKIAPSGISFW